MADYYSLLARAVANLPKPAPPTARKAIYDRARKALNNQLRALKPPLPESDILREESALEAAVNRLEDEHGGAQATEPEPRAPVARSPVRPTPPPTKPATAVAPPPRPFVPPEPIARPAAPPPIRPAAPVPTQDAQTPPVVGRAAAPPRPPARPPLPARPTRAPKIGAADEPVGGVLGAAPAVYAPLGEGESADRPTAPLLAAESASPAPHRSDPNAARPTAPRAEEPSGGRPWLWVTLALLVGLVGAIAVAAFLLRSQKPQDLALKEPPAAVAPAVDNGPKMNQRAGGESPPAPLSATPTPTTSSPAPAPTPTATPAAAATPTPVASAAAASPAPTASPTAPAPPSSPPPAQIQPATARAAMLIATPQDTQKPSVNIGTALWSSVPPNPGQSGGPGVKAEVQIPELKMRASMILRRNVDSTLPASHTIDLRITFEDGSTITGVKDIGLPQMRRDDPPQVTPLLGVRVKINETYFLIGLNRGDSDIQRNLDAVGASGWFDFPMLLNDGRIAKLTFEKGAEGDKIVAAALDAWK